MSNKSKQSTPSQKVQQCLFEKCNSCLKPFERQQKKLRCGFCESPFCNQCLDLTRYVFEALTTIENASWYCNHCAHAVPGVQKLLIRVGNVVEECSNMNASRFITFFTYMLRLNVIPFWKELVFVVFKMAPNIKEHTLNFSSYRPLYKGHSCILKFF